MTTVALKAGARFKSAVCDTQVMVVKAPAGDHALQCGGALMLAAAATADGSATLDAAHSAGTLIGKRYVNADESIELLCTKGGQGSLALDGTALDVKQAKQLPSSD
ncbi:hypothetical protein JN531_007600 [Flagellatimonas centrodinii]|uniref:hypothetical protein n=1 Tax=Flagellatimonas centrodinii TaxID=2806210 RepID=UPI001FF0555F|nr:hypothetical protein [Flagellatimonas centrodinii]ULQ48155.1 hypothetical protein JN531_007600 [Flagellatimonas centrodinii]